MSSEQCVTIDREELARMRADSAELARLKDPVALEYQKAALAEHSNWIRNRTTDQAVEYLWKKGWRIAPEPIPEGFALVPVEVRRDAERYQWLCKQAAEDSGSAFMDRAISQLSEWVTPKHEIDSTIDAAPKGDSHE